MIRPTIQSSYIQSLCSMTVIIETSLWLVGQIGNQSLSSSVPSTSKVSKKSWFLQIEFSLRSIQLRLPYVRILHLLTFSLNVPAYLGMIPKAIGSVRFSLRRRRFARHSWKTTLMSILLSIWVARWEIHGLRVYVIKNIKVLSPTEYVSAPAPRTTSHVSEAFEAE